MILDAIMFRWDGDERTMRPLTNRDLGLEHGHTYRLEPIEERSWQSHKHFFAAVDDLWQSLPERLQAQPWASDPNQMRDHALISTGWRTSEVYPCASRAEALRWRNMLPPLMRSDRGGRIRHVYTVPVVEGSTLVRWVPRSQAYRAMKGEDFQRSKDDVLGFLADLVQVAPDDLRRRRQEKQAARRDEPPAYIDDAVRLRGGG